MSVFKAFEGGKSSTKDEDGFLVKPTPLAHSFESMGVTQNGKTKFGRSGEEINFGKWLKENAPNAQFYAMFEATNAQHQNNFYQLIKNLGIPHHTIPLGTGVTMVFYTPEQNMHMLAGVKLSGINVDLIAWGPL